MGVEENGDDAFTNLMRLQLLFDEAGPWYELKGETLKSPFLRPVSCERYKLSEYEKTKKKAVVNSLEWEFDNPAISQSVKSSEVLDVCGPSPAARRRLLAVFDEGDDGALTEQLRGVYNGRRVDDESTPLASYNMREGETLHLVPRKR